MAEGRWGRLERYARWRSRRLPLDRLPEDVLGHLVSGFLTGEEVRRLVEALYGALDVNDPLDVARVPAPCRPCWLYHHMLGALGAALRGVAAETALFHAHGPTYGPARVLAFADWSPFSEPGGGKRALRPIAEYHWARGAAPPRAVVVAHRSRVVACVRDCVLRRRPVTALAFYRVRTLPHLCVVDPLPAFVTQVQVYPHRLLPLL